MNVRLVDREPVYIAYLRYTGTYGPAVGKFWMERVAPWMATNNLFGRERFGISLDDPSVTRPAQCRYDAGVASRRGEVLSGKPHHKVIPGGRYAVLAFAGTGADIPAAWQSMLRACQRRKKPRSGSYSTFEALDHCAGRLRGGLHVPSAERQR